MMKLILLLSIVSTFTSVGCKTSSSPTYTLSKEVYTDKINFGGFYGSCDSIDETCSCLNNESYVSHQLIFFENGKICEIIGRMNDSADVVLSYRDILNNDYNLYSWGTYQISDDKIKATINSLYFARGRRWKHFVTNYEGLFLSKNCITDWKAPPYPNIFHKKLYRKLNQEFTYAITNKTFRFKDFPKVSVLSPMAHSMASANLEEVSFQHCTFT